MAGSILQEKNAENTGGTTTITVTLTSSVTAGSAIHVISDYGNASALTCTYSDGTNTYTSNLDNTTDGANNFLNQGYALNCAATTPTVKVTWSAAPTNFGGIWAREVGSVSTSAIDNHAIALGTNSTTTTTTLTVNTAGALISAICADLNSNQAVTAGAGWTSGVLTGWKDNSAVNCAGSESEHFTTTGSKTITFGLAGADIPIIASMSFADAGGATFPIGQILL
jgi:hypothetical protein